MIYKRMHLRLVVKLLRCRNWWETGAIDVFLKFLIFELSWFLCRYVKMRPYIGSMLSGLFPAFLETALLKALKTAFHEIVGNAPTDSHEPNNNLCHHIFTVYFGIVCVSFHSMLMAESCRVTSYGVVSGGMIGSVLAFKCMSILLNSSWVLGFQGPWSKIVYERHACLGCVTVWDILKIMLGVVLPATNDKLLHELMMNGVTKRGLELQYKSTLWKNRDARIVTDWYHFKHFTSLFGPPRR